MSEIQIDNISGFASLEAVPSDPGLIQAPAAGSESFDDHLRRANEPEETVGDGAPGSAASAPIPPPAPDEQPESHEHPKDARDPATADFEEVTTEPASPDGGAENNLPEASGATTDANGHEQSTTGEKGAAPTHLPPLVKAEKVKAETVKAEKTSVAIRDESGRQRHGTKETAGQRQPSPEGQASQPHASSWPPSQVRQKDSSPKRLVEQVPQLAARSVPVTETAITTQVDTLTVSGEPSDSPTEQKGGAADGTPKPAAGSNNNIPESQPGALMRAGSNQVSRADSPQQSQGTTEPGQVDRVRFVRRVTRAFHAMGDRSGTIRLQLSPPELGSLRLEVSVRHGLMAARVEAETTAARNLLLENLPALRDRLAQQDIKVEQFLVDLQDRASAGLPGRTADYGPSQEGGGRAESQAAEAGGNPENRRDPARVSRPGEGTQLNVVI